MSRKSGRSRSKSLKAELEDGAQNTYKHLKLHGSHKRSEVKSVSIRTCSEDVSEMEEGYEENDITEESTVHYDIKTISVEDEITNCDGEITSENDTVCRASTQPEEDNELEIEMEEEGKVYCGESGVGRWSHYHTLCSSLPGRDKQIHLLLSLMGEPDAPTCPAIHVYGNTSTGKTLTLKTILQTLQVPHAFVNCIECYSSKLLYRTILSQLSGNDSKCDNMAMFIRLLQRYAEENCNNTIYIVIDKAERLREMEATLLPALLRLSELTHSNICTILISELVWEKFPMDTGGLSPYPIHFPQYIKNEILTIMCLDCPTGDPIPFYKTYINHIWNVFQCVCRDLGELRYLSSVLYSKYSEPVETGEIGRQETRKLWRHIEPYFRGIMSKIYLREISTTQWERAQNEVQITGGSSSASSLAQGLCQSRGTPLELPYYSKYLLIASYLASYNPSKTDKKFFSKQKQARTRKTKKPPKEKPNYQLLGPKSFPLDRLMAIFYSILEDSLAPSADIYSQISSLVTLQLITRLQTRDPLDAPKYKCLITLDGVQQIARTIGFDLAQYLYDFN